MKKTYIQPQTIVVDLHTEGIMIATSLGMYDKTVDTSSDGGQLTNKKGSNIWNSEEEETKGGIW